MQRYLDTKLGGTGSNVMNERMLQGLHLLIPKGHLGSQGSVGTGAPPLEGITERAMLAEATLVTALKIPVLRFDTSFWKIVATIVYEIAPTAIRAAPSVYASVGSVVRGLKGPYPCCQMEFGGVTAPTGMPGANEELRLPSFESGYLPVVPL